MGALELDRLTWPEVEQELLARVEAEQAGDG
jgi:hypothetical protein